MGRALTNLHLCPVACLFLPSYRTAFLLPFPRLAKVGSFLIAVLMVVTLIGLPLWFFFLRGS
jgi:hypothetical protein